MIVNELSGSRLGKQGCQVGPQGRLIIFNNHHIVATPLNHSLGHDGLSVEGIRGEHPAGNDQLSQEGRHRADFIGLILNPQLTNRYPQPVAQGAQ